MAHAQEWLFVWNARNFESYHATSYYNERVYPGNEQQGVGGVLIGAASLIALGVIAMLTTAGDREFNIFDMSVFLEVFGAGCPWFK